MSGSPSAATHLTFGFNLCEKSMNYSWSVRGPSKNLDLFGAFHPYALALNRSLHARALSLFYFATVKFMTAAGSRTRNVKDSVK